MYLDVGLQALQYSDRLDGLLDCWVSVPGCGFAEFPYRIVCFLKAFLMLLFKACVGIRDERYGNYVLSRNCSVFVLGWEPCEQQEGDVGVHTLICLRCGNPF